MSNEFNKEEAVYWFFEARYICWGCGKNNPSDRHHILPRSDSEHCSSSMLNIALLCRACHTEHGKITQEPIQILFLTKTMRYLINQQYKLKSRDYLFIEKNYKLYKLVLKEL